MTIRALPHPFGRPPRWTVVLLATCLFSCDRPSESLRTYDLVRILPAGNLFEEDLLIDIGTESARDVLTGFSWNETAGDGTSFAWSTGPSSTADLTLCEPQSSQLRLRGFPWPGFRDLEPPFQTVDIQINGAQIGRVQLSGDVEELTLETRPEALRPGRNTVSLIYGSVREPSETDGDQRALGVAWDLIQLISEASPPADPDPPSRLPYTDLLRDRLIIPPHTGVEYRLELLPGSSLLLDRLGGDGPLVVSALGDRGQPPVVTRLEPSRNLGLDLLPDDSPSVLLTLCNPGSRDLVLHNPRIEIQAL